MAVQASNAPANLTIQDFLSRVNALGGPARGSRYAVRFMVRNENSSNLLLSLPYISRLENLIYVCEQAEFPGRGFGLTSARYYGPTIQLPNTTEYQPTTISLLCHNSGFERQFFDDWQSVVNPTNNFNFNYPSDYYCDVEIFQFSEYGKGAGAFKSGANFTQISMIKTPELVYNWKLYKCWPSVVNPQPVSWQDQDVLRLQVTLNYQYWDRPGNNTFLSRGQQAQTVSPAAQILTQSISK